MIVHFQSPSEEVSFIWFSWASRDHYAVLIGVTLLISLVMFWKFFEWSERAKQNSGLFKGQFYSLCYREGYFLCVKRSKLSCCQMLPIMHECPERWQLILKFQFCHQISFFWIMSSFNFNLLYLLKITTAFLIAQGNSEDK